MAALAEQLERVLFGGNHQRRRNAVFSQLPVVLHGPFDLVSEASLRLAPLLERPYPLPNFVEPIRQRARIRAGQAQRHGKERLARQASTQDSSAVPRPYQLQLDIFWRRPARRCAHALRAARSARYSSMVRLRSVEMRPSSLWTKPTEATKGSMMWIFWSGVTTKSWRWRRRKSSRP